MLASIIKRDGTEVAFDSVKILNAITKANKASGEDMSPTDLLFVTEKVCRKLEAQNLRHVEEIQDVVEETLIQYDYAKTAKAYILYRAEHTKRRNAESYLMEIYKTLTYAPAIEEDIKRENANIDGDTAMGTMLKYGSEGAKYFTDNYVLPKDASAAHINGDIHIHDKDFYMLTETCCQIDLIPLFRNGFSTGHGHLREPNSIESYSALACIAIQANQNEMHGGQSVPHFDYAMAGGVAKTFRKEYRHAFTAFVRIRTGMDAAQAEEFSQQILLPVMPAIRMADVDELGKRMEGLVAENERDLVRAAHAYAAEEALRITDRRTYQAMEAFVHNLNTMNSRAGAQVPFSSVNYGTDTSAEGRMVVRNLLLATQAGLGSGETSIFPVQIFKVKEGVNYNESDPNYDLFKMAIKTSAMRLFPNFSFLDAPFNLQYYKPGDYNSEVAYMGCRTRVLGNVYDPDRQVTCGHRQPQLHVHQPAPPGHRGQGRSGPLLPAAGRSDRPGVPPAAAPLRYPVLQEGAQLSLPDGQRHLAGFRKAGLGRERGRSAQARHPDRGLHRSGRDPGGPDRQASRRERRVPEAGAAHRGTHAQALR